MQVRIFAESRVQETVGSSTSAAQCLSPYPTAEVGHTAGDFDHAAVAVPYGMEFDVSIEGHVLKVCLETDKARPAAVLWRPVLSAQLPLSASSTKDSARLNVSRRQACLLQGQRKPAVKISCDLLYRAALVGSHSGPLGVLPEQVV